jgi:hypothetical protein
MKSIQPIIEMSINNISGGKRLPELKADNLAAICDPII